MNIVQAKSTIIDLGCGEIDAYMLLVSQEKRIGIENIGLLLGKKEDFFLKAFSLQKNSQQKLKKLKKERGFIGDFCWVKIDTHHENFDLKRTISVRDFIRLVTYDSIENKNSKAITLLGAFAETGLEKIIEEAFGGDSIQYFQEKIYDYQKWTYDEWEEVLQENREDHQALRLGIS